MKGEIPLRIVYLVLAILALIAVIVILTQGLDIGNKVVDAGNASTLLNRG